jgi:hypothetical protein
MPFPDYHGGSIVNLMVSLIEAMGARVSGPYPPLQGIDTGAWRSHRNIVLLVIDGLGHELVRGASGALAQHLKGRLTSVFPTTTATAITTFLTGFAPQQHGLTGWFMYFRELGSVVAVLPFVTRAGGAALGKNVDAAELLGAAPLSARLPVRMHVVSPRRIIHSDFNVAHTDGARRHGFDTLKEMFQTVTHLVQEGGHERRYVYAYWPDLDHLAHEHGIGSRAAAAHLAELDEAFGYFLQRIAGTDTTVVVTGDHGIVDSGAEYAIELDAHPRLAQMLFMPLCGERRVAYCYVRPGQGAAFVDYVVSELEPYTECHASSTLIEQGCFGLGEAHPHLAERIGHYTLIMRDRYVIKDWLPGEHRHVHVGVHGGISEAEMYVPLIAVSV